MQNLDSTFYIFGLHTFPFGIHIWLDSMLKLYYDTGTSIYHCLVTSAAIAIADAYKMSLFDLMHLNSSSVRFDSRFEIQSLRCKDVRFETAIQFQICPSLVESPKIMIPRGQFLFTCSDTLAVRCIVQKQHTSSQTDSETDNSTFGRRAFSVAGPTVWNSLPMEFRDLSLGFGDFKRSLKTILFARY